MRESDFIDAINSEPDNRFHQMVYADWLDEIGDPRAEAWRVLIEAGKRPLNGPSGDWDWFGPEFCSQEKYLDDFPLSCFFPDEMSRGNGSGWWFKSFRTFFLAMDAAANRWVRCHRPQLLSFVGKEM